MDQRQAQVRIFRKQDAMRLGYEDPPRIVRIWVDGSVGAKHLDFGTVELVPGAYTPDHAHAVAEEVIWVHRGRGIYFIEGEEFPVEEGMVVFVPPGVRHHSLNTGEAVMTIIFAFSPSGTEAQFQLRKEGAGGTRLPSELPGPGTPGPSTTQE